MALSTVLTLGQNWFHTFHRICFNNWKEKKIRKCKQIWSKKKKITWKLKLLCCSGTLDIGVVMQTCRHWCDRVLDLPFYSFSKNEKLLDRNHFISKSPTKTWVDVWPTTGKDPWSDCKTELIRSKQKDTKMLTKT